MLCMLCYMLWNYKEVASCLYKVLFIKLYNIRRKVESGGRCYIFDLLVVHWGSLKINVNSGNSNPLVRRAPLGQPWVRA